MHILHYVYGLPPHRGGGLIKYALDLAKAEMVCENKVTILSPGAIHKRNSSKVKIAKCKDYAGMKSFIIRNPLPIPQANGIKDSEWFMSGYGYKAYYDFLNMIKPDIIHIHSLMGVHYSFFKAAKDLRIRMVYTSHDYFGICPITILFKQKCNCEELNWSKCNVCCKGAFSTTHLILDQLSSVQFILQTKVGKLLLNFLIKFKAILVENEIQNKNSIQEEIPNKNVKSVQEYERLEYFYKRIFKMIDFYHFNSIIARDEFVKRLGNVEHCVLPITNKECSDNRVYRKYSSPLKVGFLGSYSEYKGFKVLYQGIHALHKENIEIVLNIYFDTPRFDEDFIIQHKPYVHSELKKVMDANDVVIVPSMWRETFGLIVVEALSYGVPVIVSENVGAGMLLNQKHEIGKILKGDLYVGIKECLKELSYDKRKLEKWNTNICKMKFDFSMENHVRDIMNLCYRGIDDEK